MRLFIILFADSGYFLLTHYYQLGGLYLQTALEFRALWEIEASDVSITDIIEIKIDDVSSHLLKPTLIRPAFEANQDKILIKVPDLLDIEISSGRYIKIAPSANCTPGDIEAFVLGPALGAIFIQRGFLVLNANVISLDNSAIAITGRSGWGKSSIAAAFMKRGFEIVSDELCVIHFNGSKPEVRYSVPKIVLNMQMIQALNLESFSPAQERKNIDRYAIALKNQALKQLSLPLTHIFSLSIDETRNKFSISRSHGIRALHQLRLAVYQQAYYEGLKLNQLLFQQLNQLVQYIDVFRLPNSFEPDQLDHNIDIILRQLGI